MKPGLTCRLIALGRPSLSRLCAELSVGFILEIDCRQAPPRRSRLGGITSTIISVCLGTSGSL
jgi:hypothetical protein